jgi:integrase
MSGEVQGRSGSRVNIRASRLVAAALVRWDNRAASCLGSRPNLASADSTLSGIPLTSSPTAANRNGSISGSSGAKVHRVPLTAPALAVLHRMAQIKSKSNDCIFLGRDGSSITAKTILRALLKIAPDVTTHGFRSTFSTWCAETGGLN